MTEDLKGLKDLLSANPPPPPIPAAHARHVRAALAAFDETAITAHRHQETPELTRPTDIHWFKRFWRRTMIPYLSLPRPLALGGASLAVLALAVMVTVQTPPEIGAPAPRAVSMDKEASDEAVLEQTANVSAARAPAEAEVETRKMQISRSAAPAADVARPAHGLAPPPGLAEDRVQPNQTAHGEDKFASSPRNRVHVTAETPLSTFSIDVDTASYSYMRSALMQGVLPDPDAVRIEEMVNYFTYAYPAPETRDPPFATTVSVMATPWNPKTELLRIGIKGYELPTTEKPRSNLVFLIDTSGSMNAANKLPLLLNSLRLLLDRLEPADTVAIVAYAGSAGTVLPPTPVAEKAVILEALRRLSAGGSTAGGEGIRQAYALAEQSFDPDGINRVILATDGDFNVGITSVGSLRTFIERKRDTGIYLSVLGFGRGNYNDELMQALAQHGNGNAAYIDTLSEARKTLVEESAGLLFPIAKDVKLQLEFNPAVVAEYRLIGYETRRLNREDFRNDKVDAGEIGAGHSVTALYEITPTGSTGLRVDPLRYARTPRPAAPGGELGFLQIRYKAPDAANSTLVTRPITAADRIEPDPDTRFAAAVAGFGQLLRGGQHTGSLTYDDVLALAAGARGPDPFGYRAEFLTLVRLAKTAAALAPLPQ